MENSSNDTYKPISCSFYDQIVYFTDHRITVSIIHQTEKQEVEIITQVLNVYTDQGAEYLLTKEKLNLRLDHIMSISPI